MQRHVIVAQKNVSVMMRITVSGAPLHAGNALLNVVKWLGRQHKVDVVAQRHFWLLLPAEKQERFFAGWPVLNAVLGLPVTLPLFSQPQSIRYY